MNRLRTLGVGVLFLALLSSVVIYNWWSLSCGRCSVGMFLQPGPMGLVLLLLIGAGGLGYAIIRRRRLQRERVYRCACGVRSHPDWKFCAGCGIKHESSPLP